MNALLEATTKGDGIFQMVDSVFKQHRLKFEDLRGAQLMGHQLYWDKVGFRSRIIKVAPHVTFIYCIIHRFALSFKILSPKLSSVLSLRIMLVNHVKGSG